MSRRTSLLATIATALGIIVGFVTIGVHLGILPWATARELRTLEAEMRQEHQSVRRALREIQRQMRP